MRSRRPDVRDEVLRRREVTRSALLVLVLTSALACGPPPSNIPVVTIVGSSEGPAIVTSSASAAAAPTPSAPTHIDWLSSEEDARKKAKARKLPLVVFLFASWAVPAARMQRETWTDPRITVRSSDFVWLWLDVTDADANAQAMADHFDPTTMPSTILLDDLGHEIGRADGFAGPDEILELLRRAGAPSD